MFSECIFCYKVINSGVVHERVDRILEQKTRSIETDLSLIETSLISNYINPTETGNCCYAAICSVRTDYYQQRI